MKTMIVPISSAILATVLCVYGCHVFGMPRADLRIATLVSGAVSLSAAVSAALLARSRRQSR
jgi:hypothetical protein